MVDASTFDIKQNFPIASVAQLYADRNVKEQAIKHQQAEDLMKGIGLFGEGVESLVQKRMQQAQALTVKHYLGMSESGEMTPEQAVSAYKAKTGETDFDQLRTLLQTINPNSNPVLPPSPVSKPTAKPPTPVSLPQLGANTSTALPVLGAPQLASSSDTLSGGLPDTIPLAPQPTPSPAALLPNMKIGKGTMAAFKLMQSLQPHNVLSYKPGQGLTKVGEAGKGDQVINDTPRQSLPLSEDRAGLKYIEDFNKDSGVVRAKQGLDGAENVRQLATSRNPIAAGAIPTYMARASGEVGNLSEPDKAPFGGSRAILARVKASLNQLVTGQLSEENKGFLIDLAGVMEKSANKNLDRRGREMAKQFATVHKLHPEDVFSTLRPDSSFKEPKSDGNLRKTSQGVVYEVLP